MTAIWSNARVRKARQAPKISSPERNQPEKSFIASARGFRQSFNHARNNLSSLKKDFFKFTLEASLLLLALASVGINALASSDSFRPANNRFLGYLLNHPELNSQVVTLLETEKITFTPERERFVQEAHAASIDPSINIHLSGGTISAEEAKQNASGALTMSPDGVIVKPNTASKDATVNKDVHTYTVQPGDSIGKIASAYGVSVQTILFENKLSETDYIKPGQSLSILPTTGVKHTVQSGETVAGIAQKYKTDEETILAYNEIEVPEDILAGEVLIIPDAKFEIPESRKPKIATYSKVEVKRASVPSDYIGGSALVWPLPIRNITQYYSSRHRALDISNSQRPQFWSSGDGIIELSGWDGAYGQSVVVNHGNGMKTRYAHASELYVSAGDKVVSGQIIGRVGNTGRSYGATGNHLHFEVIKNGTKVDPLDAVQ